MSGPLIAAKTEPSALVRHLTAKARRIAEARRETRWSPRKLWPLFAGDSDA